jgi:hypothetical protein
LCNDYEQHVAWAEYQRLMQEIALDIPTHQSELDLRRADDIRIGDEGPVMRRARIAEFRNQVPLGSAQRVIAVDGEQRYLGMLIVAELYSEQSAETSTVLSLAKFKDAVLVPTMNVQSAAETFQRAGAEELAVVKDFTNRQLVGLLTEGHLMRRYAEELDKARRDLSGEG